MGEKIKADKIGVAGGRYLYLTEKKCLQDFGNNT
jgi:hypothetical protein